MNIIFKCFFFLPMLANFFSPSIALLHYYTIENYAIGKKRFKHNIYNRNTHLIAFTIDSPI